MIDWLDQTLWMPFTDFGFMRRALIAGFALSISAGPVGVLLLLRRMSLMGDALSHAVLPGAAIGYLVAGLSLWAMGIGGLVAGLLVAMMAGFTSRRSRLREDASFAGFYLISLAGGVMIVSLRGSSIDLLHVLFGTILAIDANTLYLIAGISSVTLLVLAVIYRPLVMECFDPEFLRTVKGRGGWAHHAFLLLVVLNLIAGFQSLGTLMAVGMMMLPALVARLWTSALGSMMLLSVLVGCAASLIGLVVSFNAGVASGPAIVLSAGAFYLISLVISPGGLLGRQHR
ncbi:metal ABC transporter permease [Carnimonas nigrificans]|uniref:metal ABC transporter permease n=1 Tax=Carnimonas nigrificans TaxID=64323 RepID=UPI000470D95C|nr:metal ABC transporter permease [Carnimonas nigrificans]